MESTDKPPREQSSPRDSNAPPVTVSPPWRSPASYLHEAEAVADFERLGTALRAELAPADAIEALWCDDILSLTWDSHRLRRIKKYLIETGVRTDIASALETAYPHQGFRPRHEPSRAQILAAAHARGDETATRQVEKALEARAVKGPDEVVSDYFTMVREISQIDSMIETTDKRRDTVLSNIYNRRKLLGRSPDTFDTL